MTPPTPPFDPSPETEQGYEASRSYLKERFAEWATQRSTDLDSDAGEAPIHYKYHYLDGHLTRWTQADLDEVYLRIHPGKVIAESDELDGVLAEAKAFVTFLDEVGLLDPAGDSRPDLVAHLDAIEPRFRADMADVSLWSPGKRMWSMAIAEGVALDDDAALQSFIADFNTRSDAQRQMVFGHSLPGVPLRRPPTSGRATPPGTQPRPGAARRRRKRR